MNVFFYLLRKQFKNYLISLKRNPAKIIGYLIIAAFFILVISVSMSSKEDTTHNIRDIRELGTIILALLIFIFGAALYQGLERGATFFKMSDVNLLFTSPLSSKKVLLYGIIKQTGVNLLISIFILFQVPTLIRTYGISWSDGLVILGGYITLLIISQICSMDIYMFSNGNVARKKVVKRILNGSVLILGGLCIYKMSQGASLLNAASQILEYLKYAPFVGWIKGIIYGILTGNNYMTWVNLGLISIGVSVMLMLILKSHADYYEDVLMATEHMEEVTQAMKKGIVNKDNLSKLKSEKIKSFGLKKGKGASVIFYKQLRESARSGKYGVGTFTIIQIITAFGGAFFLKKIEELEPRFIVLMMLGIMTYMQILFSSTERWATELQYHYIYLIPEHGLKKMFYASLEGLTKAGIEGFIIFVPLGMLLKVDPFFIMLCIITRISFQMLFLGLNILSQRIFGTVGSRGVFTFLYLFASVIAILPGVILSITISLKFGKNHVMMLAIIMTYNILAALIVSLFSNQIFTQMELNTKA